MPYSIAIIPDGVGRWAKANNLPLKEGYIDAMRLIDNHIEKLFEDEVFELHIYCFSKYNFKRTQFEIDCALSAEYEWLLTLKEKNHGFKIIGEISLFKDVFPPIYSFPKVQQGIKQLYLYFGYSFENYYHNYLLKSDDKFKKIDLLIRTGGSHCLSDFLPIELRYAQLYFFDKLFNDLNTDELLAIFQSFKNGIYRYGD